MIDSKRKPVNPIEWTTMNSTDMENSTTRSLLGHELLEESSNWTIESYQSDRSWWSPRVVLPKIIDQSTFGTDNFTELEVGLFMQSTDVLQEKGYRF